MYLKKKSCTFIHKIYRLVVDAASCVPEEADFSRMDHTRLAEDLRIYIPRPSNAFVPSVATQPSLPVSKGHIARNVTQEKTPRGVQYGSDLTIC